MEPKKIFIPLIGAETWCMPGDEEKAVAEAVACFCIGAERHGMGIEKELKAVEQDLNENNYGTGSTESVL